MPLWRRTLRRLDRPLNPRLFCLVALLVFALLLVPMNAFLLVPLVAVAVHPIVGFRSTRRRDAVRACLAPSTLMFSLILAVWVQSHQAVSHALVTIGKNEFVGMYLYPGVIEVGVYKHDPAGVAYLAKKKSGTARAADALGRGGGVRFQTFDNSDKVYDCFCIAAFDCRTIPVVDGWISVGWLYRGYHEKWTQARFYAHSGPLRRDMAHSSRHVGFHFAVPFLLAAALFLRTIIRLRQHERWVRTGRCQACGYDLTGNVSGVCPECGTPVKRGQLQSRRSR